MIACDHDEFDAFPLGQSFKQLDGMGGCFPGFPVPVIECISIQNDRADPSK